MRIKTVWIRDYNHTMGCECVGVCACVCACVCSSYAVYSLPCLIFNYKNHKCCSTTQIAKCYGEPLYTITEPHRYPDTQHEVPLLITTWTFMDIINGARVLKRTTEVFFFFVTHSESFPKKKNIHMWWENRRCYLSSTSTACQYCGCSQWWIVLLTMWTEWKSLYCIKRTCYSLRHHVG